MSGQCPLFLDAPMGCAGFVAVFENAPISLWHLDLSDVISRLDYLKQHGVRDFERFFDDHPNEVLTCFSKVIVKAVNQSSAALFNAADKEQLLGALPKIAGIEALPSHTATLMALIGRQTGHEGGGIYRTLDNERVDVQIRWWTLPGAECTYSDVIMTLLDVTQIKSQEKELRLYKQAIDDSIDGIAFTSLDGHLTYVNPSFYRMWGYGPDDELVGKSCFDFHQNPLDGKRVVSEMYEKGNYVGELTNVKKNGEVFETLISATLLRDEAGAPLHRFCHFVDITEKKQIQARLAESERRFHSLVELLPEAVFVSVDHKLVYVNPATVRLVGAADADELLGRSVFDFVCPDDVEVARKRLMDAEIYAQTQPARQTRVVRLDGRLVDVEVTTLPFCFNDEAGVVSICHDLTREKRDRAELDFHQEQLRSLVEQLISSEERQRCQIAAALHDNFEQSLVLIKMKVDQLAAASHDAASLKTDLRAVSDELESLSEAIETFTFELSSPTLFNVGLEAALVEWYEQTIAPRSPMKHVFSIDSAVRDLSEHMLQFLFRSLKELLMNAFKHAGAETVAVDLQFQEDCLCVNVQDDGQGFSRHVLNQRGTRSGYGLMSIQERVRHMGGHFSIASEPGKKTTVLFSIPFRNGDKQ